MEGVLGLHGLSPMKDKIKTECLERNGLDTGVLNLPDKAGQ